MAPGGVGKSFTPRFTKLLIQWVTVLVIKDQKVKPTDISQGSSRGDLIRTLASTRQLGTTTCNKVPTRLFNPNNPRWQELSASINNRYLTAQCVFKAIYFFFSLSPFMVQRSVPQNDNGLNCLGLIAYIVVKPAFNFCQKRRLLFTVWIAIYRRIGDI